MPSEYGVRAWPVTPYSDAGLTGEARSAGAPGPTIAGDGLRLDPGTGRPARAGPRGGRRRGGPLRAAQRLVDQRLLARLRQADGVARLDRPDVADRVRRWRASGRRPLDHRRGAHLGRGAGRRDVVRRPPDGPDADRLRSRRPAGRVPAGHPRRRLDVVHRDVRAGGRQRPGVAEDVGATRRRRLDHQRPEDLDVVRRRRRLLLLHLPHVVGGSAARRHQRDHRADVDAGHRGPPDHRHDDEPPLLRGLLHRRARAGRQPRRRRGQRVQADDAPARARARRRRPAGLEPRPVRAAPSSASTRPTRSCARTSPAWRRSTASGASS